MIFITNIYHGYVNSTDQSTVTNILIDDEPLTGNESVLLLWSLPLCTLSNYNIH